MNSNARIAVIVAVVVVALAGAGAFWFLRDDSPDEVSLDAATESVSTTESTEATGDAATPDAGSTDGVDGSWTVDTESGEFDYESATGTFAGFRVNEELAGIGSTQAVGRTGDVSGSMTIEGTTVTDASFDIDLTTVTTNDDRRDNRVQDALETDQFPTATFALTQSIELGDGAADGETISAIAVGDLTVHGQTNQVEFTLEAQLVEGTVVVVGSTEIGFSDYGVTVPSAPIVLSAEDRGTVELQLLLTRS